MRILAAILALCCLSGCIHSGFTMTYTTFSNAPVKPNAAPVKLSERKVHFGKWLPPWAEASRADMRNIVHTRQDEGWDVATDEKTLDLKENAQVVKAIADAVVQGIATAAKAAAGVP